MDINQNYREAVKSIKEAILRSQYRAAASVNKEQPISLLRHRTLCVGKFPYWLLGKRCN